MNHDELVTRAKAILAEAYEEAAMMIAIYLGQHPSESPKALCMEIDPDNWNALRVKAQRAEKKLQTTIEAGSYSTSTESEKAAVRHAKRVLRNSSPEQIAELLDEPAIRANVSKGQTIAAEETVKKSREAQREALGPEQSDQLDQQQRYHDAEAELFKARRALIETLRVLNAVGVGDLPDSWREEFLSTLDDIRAKADLGRALLTGSLEEELGKLLGA